MNSRVAEIWLEEPRRKPTTPAQMVRFYNRTRDRRPNRVDRLMVPLGEVVIALGQRVKLKNLAQKAKPVYQGKK